MNAVQWQKHGDHPLVVEFLYDYITEDDRKYGIQTLEGTLWVKPGDWIVGPGAKGEYWPVDDEVFKMTYEAIED